MNPPRKRPKRQATNSRTPAILVSRMYPHRLPAVHMPRQSSREYIALTALTLAAFALRIWRLDAKGLGYDEAATAIMARAPIADIISFHWEAAFEHLPLWVLLMRGWSLLAGQSEFSLRFLPAYAGVLTVPLSWALLRRIAPEKTAWRLLTTVLIATSPVLTLYAQEAPCTRWSSCSPSPLPTWRRASSTAQRRPIRSSMSLSTGPCSACNTTPSCLSLRMDFLPPLSLCGDLRCGVSTSGR